ncbi:MAG: hypothetical protein ACI9OJ_001268 [Myxococcota bacterium]|jgi:hypothetical protein
MVFRRPFVRSAVQTAFVFAIAFTLIAPGCKKPRKFVRTKAQQERVDNAVSKTAPTPKFAAGVNFADKIRLVGVDITPANPKPGAKIVVDFWWEVLAPIESDGDWKVFVHIEGPTEAGRPARVIADHYAVEDGPGGTGLYPVKEWKKGEFIKDSKTIDLVDPRGQKVGPGNVKIFVGIFDAEAWDKRQENVRLSVKDAGTGKASEDRVEVATFVVGSPKAVVPAKPFKAPTLLVRKAVTPIVIDGKLDDAAWRAAVATPALARPDGKALAPAMRTQVRALWDDQAIYFGWTVTDKSPKSTFTARDDELWKQDVVEVYLDPGADGKNYVELQVSPKNVVFDALFASHRKPDWKEARKWNLAGLQTAVNAGPIAGSSSPGWTVEIMIPWADLQAVGGAKPALGTRWKANFFRIEHPGSFSSMAAWSPVSDDQRADFHNLARGGFLVFAETPAELKKRVLAPAAPKVLPTAPVVPKVKGAAPNVPPTPATNAPKAEGAAPAPAIAKPAAAAVKAGVVKSIDKASAGAIKPGPVGIQPIPSPAVPAGTN